MSRDLMSLTDEFGFKVAALVCACAERGVVINPFYTERDPWEQARLWRRSRSGIEVRSRIWRMRAEGMDWLASVMEEVGPSTGTWATNAIPGKSWHQFGEAVDFYVSDSGLAVWEGYDYTLLAEESARLGLQSGFFWRQPDSVHVQLQRGRVFDHYNAEEVDALMKERFENK